MKSSSSLILAAALATLVLGGCKKPAEPAPATPEPKAETGTTTTDGGTTTTFEAPAPEPAQPTG